MNRTLTPNEVKRVLEAAILASPAPMPLPDLRRLFDDDIGSDTIRRLLEEIREDWSDRGVELAQLSTGWRFQTRPALQPYLERLSDEKAPKYSRAVMETLAIIAYRQPVTRGDVEDIRGVVVSPNIIRTLEERGWIDVVGHRETPGRPALYATTKAFLDDLGLRSLQELPPLEEIARSVEAGPDLLAAATTPGARAPDGAEAPQPDDADRAAHGDIADEALDGPQAAAADESEGPDRAAGRRRAITRGDAMARGDEQAAGDPEPGRESAPGDAAPRAEANGAATPARAADKPH